MLQTQKNRIIIKIVRKALKNERKIKMLFSDNPTITFTTENNKSITIEYILTVSDKKSEYGITISLYENGNIQTKTVNSISTNKNEVTSLIKTFANNKVTPTTFLDIVYDYIANKYSI